MSEKKINNINEFAEGDTMKKYRKVIMTDIHHLGASPWYLYCMEQPEDFWIGWRNYLGQNSFSGVRDGEKMPIDEDTEFLSKQKFEGIINDLKILFPYLGWEGDIREGWYISDGFVASNRPPSLLLGMKQDNNGTTFIASRGYQLSSLDMPPIDDQEVGQEGFFRSYIQDSKDYGVFIYEEYESILDNNYQQTSQKYSVEKDKSFIYFIEAKGQDKIKIGYSKYPIKRLSDMKTGSAVDLCILGTMPGGVDKEKELHSRFRYLQCSGEWFFAAKELKDYIKSTTTL